ASRIEDLGFEGDVYPKPSNYPGIVAVTLKNEDDKPEIAEKIEKEIPEAERVLASALSTTATIEKIVEAAVKAASENLDDGVSFAVRTVRRGRHPYTSVDVNYKVGSAILKRIDATVNLDYPEKIIWIEIIDDLAAVGILDGADVWKKMKPGKQEIRTYFSKASVVQMPYLGDMKPAKSMGSRIGRAVQMFEVGELVIATIGACDAKQLNWFIEGVLEGIDSRYRIQRRTYSHKPKRVNVLIEDIYQLIRDRRSEPKIIFEPEGETFSKVAHKIADLFLKRDERINLFFGSREGIPKGLFRFADLIVDLCPGITLSTEYAASSALIGISFALQNMLEPQK
ncbi:RNA-binding protein, partial [Candidatus Bathyarchaeota archaeon]